MILSQVVDELPLKFDEPSKGSKILKIYVFSGKKIE